MSNFLDYLKDNTFSVDVLQNYLRNNKIAGFTDSTKIAELKQFNFGQSNPTFGLTLLFQWN